MSWNLPDLIDIPNLQMLMDRFHAATGIPVGILGNDGEILVATGWQEICTTFHRCHPLTAARCRQSDAYIKDHLFGDNYVQYKCRNGLWELAVPIVVAGDHVATLFLGQFFYDDEEVNEEFFRGQAREFGFDLDRYLAALRRIPVFTRDKVRSIMAFYISFVDFLIGMGLAKFRQLETELTLRESEERYRTLFEGANDSIMTIRDGAIVNCNTKALEMFHCTAEDLIGKSPVELSPPVQPDGSDSAAKARERMATAQAGTPQFFEWQHVCNDGSLCNMEINLSKLEYPEKTELLAIIRDITARKQAEAALKASEAEKSLILNSTLDLIVYHDTEMKILWGNREALESAGMGPEELARHACWQIWHQRTVPCASCPVVLALETGEPHQTEVRSPDGRAWFIRGFPVKDDDGKIRGVVEFCLDITARKRLEEEIETLNTNLNSHAMELETANRELEAFSYTVSHDLRSPLAGIVGYSELLLEVFGDTLGGESLDYVRQIHKGARQMDQLIGTLLSFSRLSRITMSRESVDLTGIVKTVTGQLRMNTPCRKAKFIVAEGVQVEGDAKLLNLVMENLLGNAWKYSGHREPSLIEFGTVELDEGPAYFVRDNGRGFDMVHAEKLFKPFVRLPGTADIEGYGIGLASVQRIIQRHGGRIWAEGVPEQGATFYFTL